ncbi:O-antigen ligase family protein [Mogibacterium pumilum]|uniref:O-antigen polymerase n=1 Tax=Mogibacterium pumilum TaxID=86332 RepID=A0A223AQW8_9FIRM|nr:O-antigen ligase family protein [Mogibacterium pumilum]ASS37351.1 hypothetical protein AXF17_01950 [Mogibacterium pumilum]
MYEFKTLNHMMVFIDRIASSVKIKKGQSTVISLSVFGMMMTAFCKFSFFTEKLSQSGIPTRMVSVVSSGMFFVFLILVFISLDRNESKQVEFNAWLGVPLSLIVAAYMVTGVVEKAPKQIVWALIYSVVFVPISYRLANERNRKIFVNGLANGIAAFGIFVLVLNIVFSPIVAKNSYYGPRYTGVLTNPTILGYNLNTFIAAYVYIIYKKIFIDKADFRKLSSGLVLAIAIWGLSMSWCAILLTKSRGSFLGILGIMFFFAAIVIKGLVKTRIETKNLLTILAIAVVMITSAYKFSDNILQKNLKALNIKGHYTITHMMFGRMQEMSNFKNVDEYHFDYMEPENLTETQRKVWRDLDKLTTHRVWIWYIYSQHLGFIGHKSRTFIIPGYTKGFERQSHNATLEVTFNGGYIAGFGFLIIEVTTGIYALITLFRKKEYTDNNLEMLFLSLAAIAFCINGVFSTINTLTTYSITMMYYMALTTTGFRNSKKTED